MSDAVTTVKTFLVALGRRDMEAVDVLLGPGFRMTVSGGHVFTSPAEFAAFSKGRHKGAKKTTDGGHQFYVAGTHAAANVKW